MTDKIVRKVREAIDIAMSGGQAKVINDAGTVSMIAGDGEQIFIFDCNHFFDDGFCLLCDEPAHAPRKRGF